MTLKERIKKLAFSDGYDQLISLCDLYPILDAYLSEKIQEMEGMKKPYTNIDDHWTKSFKDYNNKAISACQAIWKEG